MTSRVFFALCALLAFGGARCQVPAFGANEFFASINQNVLNTSLVHSAFCTYSGMVRYRIQSFAPNTEFLSIDSVTGSVTLTIDSFELPQGNYTIALECYDPNDLARNDISTLFVLRVEENEFPPQFTQSGPIVATYLESLDHTINPLIVTVSATDSDRGLFGTITFTISDSSTFNIDSDSGEIRLQSAFDFETTSRYQFVVTASNPAVADMVVSRDILVVIDIEDVDDEPPTFTEANYQVEVHETAPGFDVPSPGFYTIHCDDVDTDETSITYTFCLSCPFSDPGPFELDMITGDFSVSSDLDYETRTSYSASVLCFDNSPANHSASSVVDFGILGVNEYDPVPGSTISTLVFFPETSPVGTVIVTADQEDATVPLNQHFQCTDMDAGPDGMLIYTIDEDDFDLFNVNSSTGEVSLKQQADYEILGTSNIFLPTLIVAQLTCCDVTPPAAGCPNFEFTLFLLSQNEYTPVFPQSEYVASVSELLISGSTIINGTALQCIDGDIGVGAPGDIMFSDGVLEIVSSTFHVDSSNGISTIVGLDYESTQNYVFDVQCSDGFNTIQATIRVMVEPENDNRPVFETNFYVFNVSRTTPSDGYSIGRIFAEDNDRDFGGTLTYSLEANGYFDVTDDGELLLINSVQNVSETDISFNAYVSDGTFMDDVFILVRLTDGNIEIPQFELRSRTIVISELLPIGASIAEVSCNDSDDGLNGEIRYYLADGNTDNAFFIDGFSGELYVANSLVLPQNIEEELYPLSVVCEDRGVPTYADNIVLLIRVTQDDSNPPEIGNDTITAFIGEDAAINDVVVTIVATDLDLTILNYRIENASVSGVFIIDRFSGVVTVAAALDREEISRYEMIIVVNEDGAQRSDSATLVIFVRDVNDNSPICEAPIPNVQIAETLSVGSLVLQLNCTDLDIGDNAELVYSLDDDYSVLEINDVGEITLRNPLNFTDSSVLSIDITVSDMGAPARENIYQAIVSIISTNRNAPSFENIPATIMIGETQDLGEVVFIVAAVDPDRGSFGQVLYAIENTNEALPFNIFHNTGGIFLIAKLDFFDQQEYILNISASDSDFTVTEALTVVVVDENEFLPVCDSIMITGTIAENLGPDQVLSDSLSCSDMDEGSFGQLAYRIISGNVDDAFVVQSDGVIVARRSLDFEVIERYNLIVEVADLSLTPLAINVSVSILVQPVNEFRPLFSEAMYEASIPENAVIGLSVLMVNASDMDRSTHPHGQISYTVIGLEQPFFSISSAGFLQLTGNLDRETRGSYLFNVQASDQGMPAMTSMAAINITVTDIDDSPPNFQMEFYLTFLNGSTTSGARVTNVLCIDDDLGANAEVEYSIDQISDQSQFFTVDAAGLIVVVEDLPISQTYIFSVRCVGPAPANFSDSAVVSVQVVVDSNITFLSSMYVGNVSEDAIPVQDILTVSGRSSTMAPLTYTLLDETTHFSVNRHSGLIQLISFLDHESMPEFLLRVQASDDGIPPNVAEVFIRIIVGNVNDNTPEIDANVSTIELLEGLTSAPYTVAEYSCHDNDNGTFGQVTFRISSGNTGNVFSLSSAGTLQLVGNLDFEDINSYNLEIVCEDGGDNPERDTIILPVTILPINDNPPQFEFESIPIVIDETLPLSSPISTPITATDLDLPPHNSVHYSIISGNTNPETFLISAATGQLTLIRTLDYEVRTSYSLTVLAEDSGGLPNPEFDVLSDTIEIDITVLDANDNVPHFSSTVYTGMVSESAMIGDQVLLSEAIICTDEDSGLNGQTTLTVQSEAFVFQNSIVVVNAELDFETATPINILTVVCHDNGVTSQSSEALLIISILDENEFGPEFISDPYNFAVSENTTVGTIIGSIFAVDADAGEAGIITYGFLNAAETPFVLNSDSGDITLVSSLDYETQSQSYVYSVTASDLVQNDTTSVIIQIENIDDNLPVFTQAEYFSSILENAEFGAIAGQVSCSDADDEADGIRVVYSLQEDEVPFRIEPQLGTISVSGDLDLETIPRYPLSVFCSDSNGNSVSASFTIDLLPFNDFAPVFIDAPYNVDVLENRQVGLSIFQVSATDNDNVAFNTPTYSFIGGNEESRFSIDPSSGIVRISQLIDREQEDRYLLIVQAQNVVSPDDESGSPALSTTTTLNVNVLDENDNSPIITPSNPDPVFILDSSGPGITVAEFLCMDADVGQNGETNFSISSVSTPGSFEIFENGTLLTADFIRMDVVVDITCRDNGVPISRASTVSITIITVSMNDHSPQFSIPFYEVEVREDQVVGADITCITATDMDGPDSPDGIIRYSLQLQSAGVNRFGIRETTGCVFATIGLDIEFGILYRYTIIAMDMGEVPRNATTTLHIIVLDVFRDPPSFTNAPYARTISEGVEIGTFLLQISCVDPDVNDSLTYNITGGNVEGLFTIDDITGDIQVASRLDFETATLHTLTVQCTDSTALQAEENVFVTVSPVNEHTPSFQTQPMLSIPEHSISGTLVTALMYEDGDAGPDGEVDFEIISGNINEAFLVTGDGRVLVINDLDRESRNFYSLQVRITDQTENVQNRRFSMNYVNITVTDINDQVPTFQFDPYVFGALEGTEEPGYLVGTVGCTDGDIGSNAEIVYQLMESNTNESFFDIDSSSGDIVLIGDLGNRDLDDITFFVECVDAGIRPLTGSTRVLVTVVEANLHSPMFSNVSYFVEIPEDTRIIEDIIITVEATDRDSGVNGLVRYSLQDTFNNQFFIDEDSGDISLLRPLDFESLQEYTLVVEAVDGALDSLVQRNSTVDVFIRVIGVNEFAPICARPVYVTVINETVSGEILYLDCTDADSGDDGLLSYNITSGNAMQYFLISDGRLSVPTPISPDTTIEQYILEISVSDSGSMQRQTEVDVIVIYSFENIDTPRFDMSAYFLNVSELSEVGEILSTFVASDTDPSLQGEILYTLIGTTNFRINPVSGDLFLARTLDWETSQIEEFTIIAEDSDPFSPNSGSALITIVVLNENDNVPECDQVFYVTEVFSNAAIDETVIFVMCSDPDEDILMYDLMTAQQMQFSIDAVTGRIFVSESLTPSNVVLTVVVSDGESSIEITVSIGINFVNVEPPVFTQDRYVFQIAEDAVLLSSIGTVLATDADSEIGDLSYSIVTLTDRFYVNPFSGSIHLTSPLNYEVNRRHMFVVQVEDAGGFNGSSVLNDTANIVVDVENVNDNVPLLSRGGVYGATVSESVVVGTPILNISCTDGDDEPFGFPTIATIGLLEAPFQLFGPDAHKTLEVSQILEGSSSYVINISCSDGGGVTTFGEIFVFVPEPDAPTFTESVYEWLLSEASESGSEYTEIQAVSNDGNDVSYSISDGNENEVFFIDPRSGIVSLVLPVDYETQRTHGLIIRAIDSSNRQSNVLLLVQVLDENDEIPLTPPSEFFTVPQNAPIGFPIGNLECIDDDATTNATQLNFTFIPTNSMFSVDEYGTVRLEQSLDDTPVYVLPVVCSDLTALNALSTGIVTIEVEFLNLEAPRFGSSSYIFTVEEDLVPLSLVGTVTASDGDVGSFGELSYSIVGGNPDKFFIDAATGDLRLLTALDRENLDSYNLTVISFDGGLSATNANRRTGTTMVAVTVEDINDNPPIPEQLTYVAYISTNHTELSPVLTVSCTDRDLQTNAEVDYFLDPETPEFLIQSSGTILLAREQFGEAVYNLNAVCRDRGAPMLSSSILVTVIVDLFDVRAPEFERENYNVTILEDQPIASTIIQITAISGGGIVYSISAGNDGNSFHVNPTSGDIILITSLDARAQNLYLLSIEATATERNDISSFTTLRITVIDVNDNTPSFTNSFYVASVSEAASLFTPVTQVTCNDSDTNSEISYSITGGLSTPTFNITQEGIIVVADLIDYETEILYTIDITCTDGGDAPRFATTSVRIEILPVNEFVPQFVVFAYTFLAFENSFGSFIGTVEATDDDAGSDGSVLYFLEDPGSLSVVFVEPLTGDVLVSNNLDFEDQQFWNLTVIARDGGGAESHARLNIEVININDVNPVIMPTTVVTSVRSDSAFGYPIQSYSCTDGDGSETSLSIVNAVDYFILSDSGVILWTAVADNLTSNAVISLTLTCQDIDASDQTVNAHIAVTILVSDVIPPVFSSDLYTAVVDETADLNSTILTVSATSPNSGILYSLFSLPTSFPFQVDSITGDIVVTSSLDREVEVFYSFFVRATDEITTAIGISLVEITVADSNDNAPIILPREQNIVVSENLPLGVFAAFFCTDDDIQLNGEVNFQLTTGNEMMYFNIDRNGGVSLVQPLDFESNDFYNITVVCFDGTPTPLEDTATLLIRVVGVNEYEPQFENSTYFFDINEYAQAGELVGTVNATDSDEGSDGDIQYTITSGSGRDYFTINSNGEIRTTIRLLNATETSELLITVRATDGGMLSDDAVIIISVIDVNEHPTFSEFSNLLVLNSTDLSVGSFLLELFCFDTDVGSNAELGLYIAHAPPEHFSLQTESLMKAVSGSIVLNTSLPAGSFEVTLQCFDSGNPSLRSNASVTIRVEGANSPPSFLHDLLTVSVPENTEVGVSVLSVHASDQETNVTYGIIGGNGLGTFGINTDTGDIYLILPLDYETTRSFDLTVSAYDQAIFDQLSATTEVLLDISNVNDIDPIIDPAGIQVITVSESTEISSIVKEYTCIDPDGQNIEFAIGSGMSVPFAISQSDDTGSVYLQTAVDYEALTSYNLMITCTDSEVRPGEGIRRQTTSVLIIHVLPVNMFSPTFVSPSEIFVAENATIGDVIGRVEAVDPDGRGEVTYSSITNAFLIDSVSGNISLISELDYETTQSYILDVIATDNDNVLGIIPRSTTMQLNISVTDINDNRPECAMHSLQTQLETGTYPYMYLAELDCSDRDEDDNALLTYSFIEATAPFIPNGMFVLNATTGEFGFTGTITVTDTIRIEVRVSDSGDVSLSSEVTIVVQVISTNLSTPHFNPDSFDVTISENTPTFSVIFNGSLLLSALVNPAGDEVQFALSANPLYFGTFIIDSITGNIMLFSMDLLDFDEGIQDYLLIVQATVGNNLPSAIVNVMLVDSNDNAPSFSQTSYDASVLENQDAGVIVLQLEATDIDSGTNSQLIFVVNDIIDFTINASSGELSTLQSFDREVNERYSFLVLAIDMGNPQLTGSALVTVTVLDENDEPPVFTQSTYIRDIDNISPPGSPLLTLEVIDADITNSFTFQIITNDPEVRELFTVESPQGILRQRSVSIPIDHEQQYSFIVEVNDGRHTDMATVIIYVASVTTDVTIFEENVAGQKYDAAEFLILQDFNITSNVVYEIVEGDEFEEFRVYSNGTLTTTAVLDREIISEYELNIHVTDNSSSENVNLYVTIIVMDQNDNIPAFNASLYNFTIPEGSYPEPTLVGTVHATDNDAPGTGASIIEYSFILQSDIFSINRASGEIFIQAGSTLDREREDSHTLTVRARDFGEPNPQLTFAMIVVGLEDVNDNDPEFVPVDILEFVVEIDFFVPANTTLVLIAILPGNNEITQSSFEYLDRDSSSVVTPRLITVHGESKFDLVSNNSDTLLITTDSVTLEDSGTLLQIILRDEPEEVEQRPVVRNITVIVLNQTATTSPSTTATTDTTGTTSSVAPTGFFETEIGIAVIVVICALIFALMFFFCTLGFYCYLRIRRGKDPLRNRDRTTTVAQRLLTETDRRGRKGFAKPWQYYSYSDIDKIDFPEFSPDDPDTQYLYGPGEFESSFMGGAEQRFGDPFQQETPSTGISVLSNPPLVADEESDDDSNRMYTMGPVLKAMLEQWDRGEELLKKEKKKKSRSKQN